ncbi:hypothetical protein HB777_23840 [Mesorhizobium loti]|nr:hypothetical protein HB777_23840 [Mesorhizobium loti]
MVVATRRTAPQPGPKFDAAVFANKHGLALQAARVILAANGPSRIACDAAAKAFLVAGEMR